MPESRLLLRERTCFRGASRHISPRARSLPTRLNDSRATACGFGLADGLLELAPQVLVGNLVVKRTSAVLTTVPSSRGERCAAASFRSTNRSWVRGPSIWVTKWLDWNASIAS